MPKGKRAPAGLSRSRIALLFSAAAVVLGGFMYWAAQRNEDPMCAALASSFAAECRKDLPLDTALTAGIILNAGDGPAEAQVGLLNSSACLVPGAVSAGMPPRQRPLQPDALPAMAYTALRGRGLQAVPAPPDLFAPVASWRAVHEVGLELSGLSESVLADAGLDGSPARPVANICLLQQACADHLKDGSWRIVGSTIRADRVRYQFLNARAQPVAPPAGALQADADGWRLLGSHVVGVRYLDAGAVAALTACALPVARIHGGHVRVRISGSGQRGAVATETMQQPLGKIALVSSRGKEVSDCNTETGREQSHAYAQAQLDTLPDGGLRMAGEIRASGGRYRVGRCPTAGRRLPATNTLVNAAGAMLSIQGTLDVAVRAAGPHTLRVVWEGAPPNAEQGGMRLAIIAPGGVVLRQGQPVGEDGSLEFAVAGPGLFRLQPVIDAQIRRRGESGVKSHSFHARLHAEAWPTGTEQGSRAE